jgi:hypothetical protein
MKYRLSKTYDLTSYMGIVSYQGVTRYTIADTRTQAYANMYKLAAWFMAGGHADLLGER